MTADVHVQRDAGVEAPDDASFRRWISATCDLLQQPGAQRPEVSLRISDSNQMTQLNQRFRDRPGPTNVLSFPADLPADVDCPLLGDIVICAPLVAQEAMEQGKDTRCHWAHLTVHGVLHLLGYDHQTSATADAMERLEANILGQFGCPDPYLSPVPEQ